MPLGKFLAPEGEPLGEIFAGALSLIGSTKNRALLAMVKCWYLLVIQREEVRKRDAVFDLGTYLDPERVPLENLLQAPPPFTMTTRKRKPLALRHRRYLPWKEWVEGIRWRTVSYQGAYPSPEGIPLENFFTCSLPVYINLG